VGETRHRPPSARLGHLRGLVCHGRRCGTVLHSPDQSNSFRKESAMRYPPENKVRLEQSTMPVTESGCWIWLLRVDTPGYGRIAANRSSVPAHRVSWVTYRGTIPDGMQVLHKCDVRCCVNPDHLFLGTHSDNMRDMYAKGRHPRSGQRGEKHHRAKLTAQEVAEIRSSSELQKILAQKYRVGQSQISSIRRGASWRQAS
jgi:hypothetical protein